ncbi:MAG: hypothetical protein PSX37_11075 [bacterium]|nr:hypothetical protein [bacterium]
MIQTNPATTPTVTVLAREQLVSRIVDLNPTATNAFLNSFSVDELQQYFDHLRNSDRGLMWVRPAGTRAVVARESQV